MDWGHRLWVASRVTVARLWVGGIPPGHDRRLPVAPWGRRARVQGAAALIWRRGTGMGHDGSKAEERPQLLRPGALDGASPASWCRLFVSFFMMCILTNVR